MRLIDVEALIDDCKKYLNKLNPSRDGKECARIHWLIGVLSNAQAIEPEPQWMPCSKTIPNGTEGRAMTLEDAIKHAEEVAEENEKEFRLCPYPSEDCNGNQDCRCLENGEGKGCLRCAAEYRQLAEWLKELKERRRKNACYERLVEAVDTAISALQAQDAPDTNVDTISRQAAIDAALEDVSDKRTHDFNAGATRAANRIKQLPFAQPEIIRCKDCKHYNAGFECLIEGYGIERSADWYCADAERREE